MVTAHTATASRCSHCKPPPVPLLCEHARLPGVAENITTAVNYLHTLECVRASPDAAPPVASREDANLGQLLCFECGVGWGLSACLQCFYIGCRKCHLDQHFQMSGHMVALDCELHKVHCRRCRDFVHDAELETFVERGRAAVVQRYRRLASQTSQPGLENTKPRNVAAPQVNAALLRERCLALPDRKASILGLRGMTNMGNTCFMSSVLQALVHNPYLRNVFLSDCEWSNANTVVVASPRAGAVGGGLGEPTAATPQPPSSALREDFLRLFADMYSGETKPYAPYFILYTVWKHAELLSGYAQHDAHEFLIYVLNQLHAQMQWQGSASGGGSEWQEYCINSYGVRGVGCLCLSQCAFISVSFVCSLT